MENLNNKIFKNKKIKKIAMLNKIILKNKKK
jgi:hypothetical protein